MKDANPSVMEYDSCPVRGSLARGRRGLMTTTPRIAVLMVALLIMALFFAAPAYASASDEAEQSANDAYNWVWCEAGYYNYC